MFWKKKREPPPALRPPSLFNPKKLDLIAQLKDGTVALYIIQDEPWTSAPDEVRSLSEKLSMYATYVLDGHLAAQYPDMAGSPWRIVIDSYTGRPDDATMVALGATGDELAGLGGDLVFHELLPPAPGTKLPTTIRTVRLRTSGEEPISPHGDAE